MDVKTAFLNDKIEEEVYIERPNVFEVDDMEKHACRLNKSMYGIK
jgi:hypothetical protein